MSPRTQHDIAAQTRLVANLYTASPASAQSYVDDVTERAGKAIADADWRRRPRARAFAALLTSFAAADALFHLNAQADR